MELQRIKIKNFRSIKDMTIEIKEINGKKCIILVGKNEAEKKDFIENYPEFKDNWVDYSVCGSNFKTLEDFYQKDYVDKKLKEQNITIDKSCQKTNMIDYIEAHIKTLQLDEKKNKQLKQKVKYNLATNAIKANIKKEYFDFLQKLKEKIKDLEKSN